jgi:hypothetical protein
MPLSRNPVNGMFPLPFHCFKNPTVLHVIRLVFVLTFMQKVCWFVWSLASFLCKCLFFIEYLTHWRAAVPTGYCPIDRGSEVPTILTSLSEKTQKSNHLLMSI